MERERRAAALDSLGGFAAAGLATFVTYLCVSGSIGGDEIVAGLIVATLATLAVAASVRLAGVRQHVEVGWLGHLGRPGLDVVTQIAPLAAALLSSLLGRHPLMAEANERAFDPGASEDASAAGRRALVTIALSISPASLICERDLDCHELVVASVGLAQPSEPLDPCWPL